MLALHIPGHEDTQLKRVDAVLQEYKDQNYFQGIRQSRGDAVQEFLGRIRLGTHERTSLWSGWYPQPS